MQIHNSKPTVNLSWIFKYAAAVLLFAGCGGGGGGDDSDGENTPEPPDESEWFAPETMGGRLLTLQDQGGNYRQIEFYSAQNTWSETGTQGLANGTYAYKQDGQNTGSITLTQPEDTVTIVLTFSTPEGGVYTYANGSTESGNFTLSSIAEDPDGNDPPDGEPPIQTGLAPVSLAGKTMLGTRTSANNGGNGQTHVYTFTQTTFHDSDPPEESDGNYSYSPSGDRADLILQYTYPQNFNGDRHELDLNFLSETRGTFTSIYTRRDGTIISINGSFEIQ